MNEEQKPLCACATTTEQESSAADICDNKPETNSARGNCCCASSAGQLDQVIPIVNWPAVFSVLCGALGLTLITILQPYAVALGIIGLFQARKNGKGMVPSIIGLGLGISGVISTLIFYFVKGI